MRKHVQGFAGGWWRADRVIGAADSLQAMGPFRRGRADRSGWPAKPPTCAADLIAGQNRYV